MKVQQASDFPAQRVLRDLLERFRASSSSGKQRAADERRLEKALACAHACKEQDSVLPGIEVTYLDL
ncbi:hypothetical protein [uncultured Ramlibacter sp.]|uniref:hypothetical protein n=1 Tax=uncultured Ramlibacter sp. TaxID=260755 RepID=UPI00262BAEB5|nr:hypothetical protein [uncultured Ramlibacter sp.]